MELELVLVDGIRCCDALTLLAVMLYVEKDGVSLGAIHAF